MIQEFSLPEVSWDGLGGVWGSFLVLVAVPLLAVLALRVAAFAFSRMLALFSARGMGTLIGREDAAYDYGYNEGYESTWEALENPDGLGPDNRVIDGEVYFLPSGLEPRH